MLELTLDETIYDDRSADAEDGASTGQAAVNDLRLCIHLPSLFTVRERGEARANKSIEE